MVAVQETLSNNSGKNVRLSVIIGPYFAVKSPLRWKRRYCIRGIYAAITGSRCFGCRIGKFLLMNKFDDHPRKQALITPLACKIDAGIPP
jgi:hypothetical protein